MTNGYDAFGQRIAHSKSEFLSLETMNKLDSIISGMICIEEDNKLQIHQEEETAYSEWNDNIDVELREILENLYVAINTARNSYICSLDQLQKCIQQRRDYLCSTEEMSPNNHSEGYHNETAAV